MLEVRIRKDSQQRLSSFLATGHVDLAESGQDVVCAAISAILQAAWFGLKEVAKVEVQGNSKSGWLDLRWPAAVRDDPAVRAIVATAALSVERIAAQYPDHVRIIHEQATGETGRG
ncbi:MAG: ribosomal-processing cysteine protease Prp [Candidatus Baltobacteraceae bacterium]